MKLPFIGEVFSKPPSVRDQLLAKLEHAENELAARMLENIDMMAGYVDPRDRMIDPDGTRWHPIGSNEQGLSVTDRSQIRDETRLTEVRDQCRNLAVVNPFAINLLENMVNYVVGDGHKPTIVAQKGEDVAPEALKQVQEVLDEWMYRHRFVERQQESVRRFDRDGEYFRRFFVQANGDIAIRTVEPNHVYRPQRDQRPEALFGIETDPDDVETVKGYWIDGVLVDPEEIQHVKANVDMNVRRGVPTLWPIASLLDQAVDVLESIVTTSQIQTRIALIRRNLNGTAAGAQNLRASAASWVQTDPQTGKREFFEKRRKGQIIDAPANTEYDFPASGLDVTKYGAGVQAILRACAARVCFPEFMFTSDASNANYASTMVAEGPAVRMFQRRQKLQEEADLFVLWKVLAAKSEAGAFAADLLERIEIQMEPPRVQVRDEKADAETAAVLFEKKILSRQTWSAKSLLDYEQEQQNIKEDEKTHNPPEVDPVQRNGSPPDETPNDANKRARMEAIEAYLGERA